MPYIKPGWGYFREVNGNLKGDFFGEGAHDREEKAEEAS